MKESVKSDMLMMLGTGSSSDLISAVLTLAQTADMRLHPSAVSAACERVKAFYDGIKALELQAPPTAELSSRIKRRGNLSLESSNKRRSVADGRRPELEASQVRKVISSVEHYLSK
jgi:hypothetical protein